MTVCNMSIEARPRWLIAPDEKGVRV